MGHRLLKCSSMSCVDALKVGDKFGGGRGGATRQRSKTVGCSVITWSAPNGGESPNHT